MLAAGGAMFGLFFVLSLFLQDVLGYTALEAGVSQLPLAGTLVVSAAAVSPLIDRIGVRSVLVAGLGIFSVGLGWFSVMPADASFLGDILGPSLLVGVGLALAFVALTIASVAGVRDSDYGLASGLINTTQQIGGALGLAILIPIANSRIESVAGGSQPTEVAISEGLQAALMGAAALGVIATIVAAVALRGAKRPSVATDEPVPGEVA
jgi:MFS family permease